MKDRLVTIVLSVAATLGWMKAESQGPKQLEVDRLIVRQELIVSDTGQPWEKGYEEHQIPRGIYAKSIGKGIGGLWVRSRLIKGDIDDPFDDRFHALERDGSLRRAGSHLVERLARWRVAADGDHSGRRVGVQRDAARSVERLNASRQDPPAKLSARASRAADRRVDRPRDDVAGRRRLRRRRTASTHGRVDAVGRPNAGRAHCHAGDTQGASR